MPYLSGLPETKGELDCVIVRSVTAAKKVLRKGLAATGAGDNGAWHVWRDDNGELRGESFCRMVKQDSRVFTNIKNMEPWLRKWLKKVR